MTKNYEIAQRTSQEYPYARKDAGTIYIPVDIKETELTVPVTTEDDTSVPETEIVSGFSFTEYRINKAEDLPNEIVQAIIEAFIEDENALKELGM